MSLLNTVVSTLTGAGGVAPYTFIVLSDAETTIPATISGATLTVDATTKQPGAYSVHVQITDAVGNISTTVLPIQVQDPSLFAILTPSLVYPPTSLPSTVSTVLQSTGGSGAVTWSLIPSVTTLPGAALTTGGNLTFTLTQYGSWTLGLRVVDSLGNTASRVIEVAISSGSAYSLIDGQVEIDVNVPTTSTGTHHFTLTLLDATPNVIQQTFTYAAAQEVSGIEIVEAAIDHFWGPEDTTSVVYPIVGDLTGFTLGATSALLANNGLTASIDTVNKVLTVTGPPATFGNAELAVPIALYRGNTQVALVTRTFTLLSHSSATDLANLTCLTKPYIVGEIVGLNPKKPFFNSPEIYSSAAYTVRVQAGSSLPSGLSLDAVTGLVYGTVLAANVASSVIEYVDPQNTVHGTITIQWDIQSSAFPMVDTLTIGQLQAAYSSLLTGPTASTLTSVSVYRGRLPAGLAAGIDGLGKNVAITGTPTEAGYFDIWLRITNSSGQVGYFYKRFAVAYAPPLVILTGALISPAIGQPYSQMLQAFGGVAPYTWALTGGALPTGITLNAVSGELSGTTALTAYQQSLTFSVTDTRGVVASATLEMTLVTQLAITTPVLPIVTSGRAYVCQLQAIGGTTPYNWSLAAGSPILPSGISLSSAGVLSGISSQGSYAQDIVFEVTDATSASVTKSLPLQISDSTDLLVDTSGVGTPIRGASYQGLVRVVGLGVGPYTWSIAPNSVNPIPTGLTFTADSATLGATATFAGVVTAVLVNYAVSVQVVDANGNSAIGFAVFNSISSLAVSNGNPLPQASVGSNYSLQLTATGVNPAFVWALASGSAPLPTGLSLSSAGLLYGTPTTMYTGPLTFQVMDALGDVATGTRNFYCLATTLDIVTTTLTNIAAGTPYNQALAAVGGTAPYAWSVSPFSASQLPAGISLSSTTGVLTGTSNLVGFTASVTFRVTDSVGAYVEKVLTVNVVAGLKVLSGIDYNLGLTTGMLGYCSGGDVTSINPRPAGSFLVVATGVVSTSTSTFSATLPAGFSVQQYQFQSGGVVVMLLSGPFGLAPVGTNNLNLVVTDNSVNVSATLQWIVTTDSTIRLAPATGTLPIIYLD